MLPRANKTNGNHFGSRPCKNTHGNPCFLQLADVPFPLSIKEQKNNTGQRQKSVTAG